MFFRSVIFENAQKNKEKYEYKFFLWFLFQNSKMPFLEGQPIFLAIFFVSFSFQNNRHTNVILISIF